MHRNAALPSSIVVSVLVFVVSAEPAPEPLEALFEQAASEIAVKPDITPVNIHLRFAINTSKFLYRV